VQGIVSVGRLDGVTIAGRAIANRLRARYEEAVAAGEP
jgi:hypothetical protein